MTIATRPKPDGNGNINIHIPATRQQALHVCSGTHVAFPKRVTYDLLRVPGVPRGVQEVYFEIRRARQKYLVQPMIFPVAERPESQALQAARKSCIVQALIEMAAKLQALQAGRKNCIVQALIESIAK